MVASLDMATGFPNYISSNQSPDIFLLFSVFTLRMISEIAAIR